MITEYNKRVNEHLIEQNSLLKSVLTHKVINILANYLLFYCKLNVDYGLEMVNGVFGNIIYKIMVISPWVHNKLTKVEFYYILIIYRF